MSATQASHSPVAGGLLKFWTFWRHSFGRQQYRPRKIIYKKQINRQIKRIFVELMLIGGLWVTIFLSNLKLISRATLKFSHCNHCYWWFVYLFVTFLFCNSVQNTQRCTVWGKSCGEGFASFVAWFLSCPGNHEQGDWRVSFQSTASSWTNGPNYIQGKRNTLPLLSRAHQSISVTKLL